MTHLRCGHCYRPATSTIYRRPAWRTLLGRPPEARIVCDEHRESYRRPRRRFGRAR